MTVLSGNTDFWSACARRCGTERDRLAALPRPRWAGSVALSEVESIMPQVDTVADVQQFFQEQVQAASRRLEVDTREVTESYLVRLLSGFSITPDVPPLDAPLVEVLGWALQARGADRLHRMRCLGDLALFRCGFFPDSLERRGVSESYAIAMGGRAYDEVASTAGRSTTPKAAILDAELFEELALRFAVFVRVLDEVREQTAMQTDADLTRLYARFRTTGSPTLLRRLQRHGMSHWQRKGSGGVH